MSTLMANHEMLPHPGPPGGPAFDGLVRFCFVQRVSDEGVAQTFLVRRDDGDRIPIREMFEAADRIFGHVEGIDVFVLLRDTWYLDGAGVPRDFAEA